LSSPSPWRSSRGCLEQLRTRMVRCSGRRGYPHSKSTVGRRERLGSIS
jgi:hypothetical protein